MKKLAVCVLLIPVILTLSAFSVAATENKDFIKWIDFNVSAGILQKAHAAHKTLLDLGIDDIGTCELLAYVAVKNGNNFNLKSDSQTLNKLLPELKNKNFEKIENYKDNKYFNYYVNAYHAVLDGIICPRTATVIGAHPIARGFWHRGSDDFGNSRSYGFRRKHLGHDLFGGVGAPIIAVESGEVTELGWNRYGGWRVGIRSHDTKRYYYYAHLRKDKPFATGLELGDHVQAGQVIGFLGRTGYSRKENKNMDSPSHLHFGMQIIFDKSQEDGNGEIWIDVYQICKFLEKYKVRVEKNSVLNEWESNAKPWAGEEDGYHCVDWWRF